MVLSSLPFLGTSESHMEQEARILSIMQYSYILRSYSKQKCLARLIIVHT